MFWVLYNTNASTVDTEAETCRTSSEELSLASLQMIPQGSTEPDDELDKQVKHKTQPAFPVTFPAHDAPHVEQEIMSSASSRLLSNSSLSAAPIPGGFTPSLRLPGGRPLCLVSACLGFFLCCSFFTGLLPDQATGKRC